MANKKKKTSIKKPPLSALDKFIYFTFYILSVAVGLAVFFIPVVIADTIAFSDPNILAVDNHSSDMFYFPSAIITIVVLLIITESGYSKKQPLIGDKKNGSRQAAQPIFSKSFLNNLTANKKKMIRRTAVFIASLLAVTFIISPFGICRKTVLTTKETIETYNSFNRVTQSVSLDDADMLVISIVKENPFRRIGHNTAQRIYNAARRQMSSHYRIQLQIGFNNDSIILFLGQFNNLTMNEKLHAMVRIKSFFSDDEYEIKNADRIDKLLTDHSYSESELALIYELFDIKS